MLAYKKILLLRFEIIKKKKKRKLALEILKRYRVTHFTRVKKKF